MQQNKQPRYVRPRIEEDTWKLLRYLLDQKFCRAEVVVQEGRLTRVECLKQSVKPEDLK